MLAEIKGSLKLLQLGLSEAVWQTRCVICDVPGVALCDKCSRELPYLDQLSSCPTCGAPWGRGICCECNQQTLHWKGLAHFPLDGCVSAVLLSPETKRIVTVFKDRGEQQLSGIIARHMANVLPPSWQAGAALVPIPARINAVRERGFDHVLLIGAELSRMTGMPLTPLLRARPRRDQRNLDAKQRLANMVGIVRSRTKRSPSLQEHSQNTLGHQPPHHIDRRCVHNGSNPLHRRKHPTGQQARKKSMQ